MGAEWLPTSKCSPLVTMQADVAIPGKGCGVCRANLVCVHHHTPRKTSIGTKKDSIVTSIKVTQRQFVIPTHTIWHLFILLVISQDKKWNDKQIASGIVTSVKQTNTKWILAKFLCTPFFKKYHVVLTYAYIASFEKMIHILIHQHRIYFVMFCSFVSYRKNVDDLDEMGTYFQLRNVTKIFYYTVTYIRHCHKNVGSTFVNEKKTECAGIELLHH